MRAFPDHPFLSGNYRPVLMEIDAPDLVVAGPVACAQLQIRVPYGFHGNWRPQ